MSDAPKDILVAPILNKGQTKRNVVVPVGTWVDQKGNEYSKGTYELSSNLGEPLFLMRKSN